MSGRLSNRSDAVRRAYRGRVRGWIGLASLAALTLISAIALVYVQHTRRIAFAELRALESERDNLQVHWGRLQIEHGTLASPERVQELARNKLKLIPPDATRIEFVSRER